MNIIDLISKLFDPFKDPKKLNLILICIILSETIGGFLYIKGLQERAKPVNDIMVAYDKAYDKEVSAIQAEHSLEIRIYKHRIDSLEAVIDKKEDELFRLGTKLTRLQQQKGNEEEIALLIEEIALKEHEIKFYKNQATYLENRLEQVKQQEKIQQQIEEPPKENLVINVQQDDIQDEPVIDVSQLNLSSKIPRQGKIKSLRVVVSQGTTAYNMSNLKEMLEIPSKEKGEAILPLITSVIEDTIYLFTGFRKKPEALSDREAKLMVLEYNFVDLRCNPYGRGFANKFKEKEIEGDDVIIDEAASLMWLLGGSLEMMNFYEAKSWIKALNLKGYAGFHDWRLPTLEEALSILERRKQNNDLYINFLFSSNQKYIWTSDSVKNQSKAWFVFFHSGFYYKSSFSHRYYVKAVRTIKSSELLTKK